MTYRCGLGPGLGDTPPQITCDSPACDAKILIDGLPPRWFLANKAKPGWTLTRVETDGAVDRTDYCPEHAAIEAKPVERPILFKAEMVRQILAGAKSQTRRILDLSRAIGEPVAEAGQVLELHYPGSKLHYGMVCPANHERTAWQVQRLCCEARCTPSPKDVYPPTGHVDWKGPVDGYPGPYDGRHPVAWGPLPFWPGLRLWVKETWWPRTGDKRRSEVLYRVTDEAKMLPNSVAWKSPLFMPRWASRITLEVTAVRIERLQAITEEDARAEGVSQGTIPADDHAPARVGFVLGPDDGKCVLYSTAREAFAKGWDSINGEKAPWKSDPVVVAVGFKMLETK